MPRLRTARWALGLAALIAVAGIGLSVSMGALLTRNQEAAAERELDRRTDLVTAVVTARMARYVDTVRLVAAALGAHTPLTASAFAQTTAAAQDMQLAGASSIAFMAPATDAQLPTLAATWRARGAPGLVLRPVGTAHEHIFSIFVATMQAGQTPILAGSDVSQSTAATEAQNHARASRQVSVSGAYVLIIDQHLPADQRQLSFVFTAPVYAAVGAGGQGSFLGWVSMGLRGQDFMASTLQRISQGQLDITLNARGADHTLGPVAALHAAAKGERDLHRTVRVAVANRQWQLDIAAHGASLPGAGGALPIAVLGGGSLLAVLLAALVWLLATGRARAESRVLAATVELREQKNLLEAIMDSVGEGIVVVDHLGRFLLTNAAAAPFLTVDGREVTNSRWDEYAQFFRADGVTPFPVTDMPSALALAGESSDDVEIVCRTASGDVVLSTSARPLGRRAGRPGAVGVFRDVTARKNAENALAQTAADLSSELARRAETEIELRAREAELTAFAGMVAHDLKSPLRAVAGFTLMLRDELADSVPGGLSAAVGARIDKISDAAARMGRLIDGLLSYASARDRTLRPEPIDLREMIAEIVTERTDEVHVEVGALPSVQADPVMCRQLLDNLIGNALKYTRPGEPADVRVSGRLEAGHLTVVEIADHGIGIPPGEHELVFASFHRAHSEYGGTGLGLAICQRIVERHGGTIGVVDNPGGGSVFRFTLPSGPPVEAAGDAGVGAQVGARS